MPSDTFPYYQTDSNPDIHRGAIYEFRPVMWLKPPLWIAEVINFGNPGSANLHNWSNSPDRFFHSYADEHKEYVLATAKIRHIIVLSNQKELRMPSFKQILVVPLYTLRSDKSWYEPIQSNQKVDTFYLPPHDDDKDMRERFANFLEIHRINRDFLDTEKKLPYCLTQKAINALLKKYQNYLSL